MRDVSSIEFSYMYFGLFGPRLATVRVGRGILEDSDVKLSYGQNQLRVLI